MKYIKQLDSLRAIAIITVIIVHWFPKDNYLYVISSAIEAPVIFFTLSGFLITSILIKERNRTNDGSNAKLLIFRDFFFKRVLRIFPAYFFTLAIFYFFRPPTADVIDFRYFTTFTANIYIYKIQQWPALAHLWSLSVEEQFYLVWPWVILFVNRTYLPLMIFFILLIGISVQAVTPQNDFTGVLIYNCLDALSIGGLLGWFAVTKPQILVKSYKRLTIGACIVFALLFLHKYFEVLQFISSGTLISLLSAWLIIFFIRRDERSPYLFSFLLENKALMFIGKISFGLYLYHFLIPYYTYPFFSALNNKLHLPAWIRLNTYTWMMQNFVLLLVMSILSYKLLELPFMHFKKHFQKKPSVIQLSPTTTLPQTINAHKN